MHIKYACYVQSTRVILIMPDQTKDCMANMNKKHANHYNLWWYQIQLNLKTARDLRLFGFSWRKCQEFWNFSYKLWFWHKRPMLAQTTMEIGELVKNCLVKLLCQGVTPSPLGRKFVLPKKYGKIWGFRIPFRESPPLWPHKNFTHKGWIFFSK